MTNNNNISKPSLGWRVVLSVLCLAAWYALHQVWSVVESPARGVATAQQLNDTVAAAATAKIIAQDTHLKMLNWSALLVLGMVWGSFFWRRRTATPLAAAALMLVFFSGCKPYKVLDMKEIKPNETAWVIPLDAKTRDGQIKFESVSYLEERKVAAKRIMIDKVERETGRAYWDIEWIPAAMVITVDRSLVSREWFDDGPGGKREEAFHVVTSDGVKLSFGVTTTGLIEETNSSAYLYYHGTKPLSEVLDTNVRNFMLAEFTREIAVVPFSKFNTNFPAITSKVLSDTQVEFFPRGVSIPYMGIARAAKIEDDKIQDSMNRSFVAQQDATTASFEFTAQQTRNSNSVSKAKAEADAAGMFANAAENLRLKNDLEIRMKYAEAALAMATNWNGQLPANILPSDSPMLMSLSAGQQGFGGLSTTNRGR